MLMMRSRVLCSMLAKLGPQVRAALQTATRCVQCLLRTHILLPVCTLRLLVRLQAAVDLC